VWQDEALHSAQARRQKASTWLKQQHCSLTTGNNAWKTGLDVVVEGRSTGRRRDRLVRLADAWASKYSGDWQFEEANAAFQGDGGEALVFEVVPVKVIAFAKGSFAQTRYRF
jgi:hypothetical protein